MATKLFVRDSLLAGAGTGHYPDYSAYQLLTVTGTSASNIAGEISAGATELQLRTPELSAGFYSERLASSVSMSGVMNLSIRASESAGTNASIRVKVFAMSYGGSNVLTLIAQGDLGVALTTTLTTYTFSVTPAAAVAVAVNQRLVVRFYTIPAPSQTLAAGTVTFQMDVSTTWCEVAETLTFLPNMTRLYPRRTAVAAIGNFFDLLSTRGGSAFTTGVVNTTAGGTEIQWTRTAGGTVLEWITPRFKNGWRAEDPGTGDLAFTMTFWGFESAGQANATWRARLFRWRAGVESDFANMAYGWAELGTSAAATAEEPELPYGALTAMDFLPDDRMVLRLYIIPVPTLTMGGSRTVTVNYDHNVANVNGDTNLNMFQGVLFKAEADPAEPPPPQQAMMGMGA